MESSGGPHAAAGPGAQGERTHFTRWLGALLLAVLAYRALAPFLLAWDLLSYPLDFFADESFWLVLVRRLAAGATLYNDSSELPLLGNVYPPLYFWLMWLLTRVSGLSIWALRVWALVPFVGCMVLVGLYLRRKGAAGPIVWGGVFLLPACSTWSWCFVQPRCDPWLVFFAFAGLYVLATAERSRARAVTGGVLNAAALFCKQTGLFGLGAVHLHLLFSNRRAGLWAAFAAVGACTVLLGLGLAQFGSQLLHSMLVLTVRREFDAERFQTVVLPILSANAPLIAVTAGRLAVHLVRRQWDLLDSYLLGHAVPGIFMLCDGAYVNYVLALAPGMCVAAGLSLDELRRSPWRDRAFGPLAAVGVLLQVVLSTAGDRSLRPPAGAHLEEARRAARFLSEARGPVYAERLWLPVGERAEFLTDYVEPTHIRALAEPRRAMAAVEAALASRRFERLLIYRHSVTWPGFPEEAGRHYRLVGRGEILTAYGPAEILYFVRPAEPAGATGAPARGSAGEAPAAPAGGSVRERSSPEGVERKPPPPL
jgi:hypothetical protein